MCTCFCNVMPLSSELDLARGPMAHVIVPVGPPTRAPCSSSIEGAVIVVSQRRRRRRSSSSSSKQRQQLARAWRCCCTYVRIGLSVASSQSSRGPWAVHFSPHSTPELTIAMRRACMYSYSSLLLASSYVASSRVSAFTLASSSVVHPAPAAAAVARDIMTSPSRLAMVRNRGLEIPEEGATPLRKCFYFELLCSIVLMTISSAT